MRLAGETKALASLYNKVSLQSKNVRNTNLA